MFRGISSATYDAFVPGGTRMPVPLPEAQAWVAPLLQQVRDDQTIAVDATLTELEPRLLEAQCIKAYRATRQMRKPAVQHPTPPALRITAGKAIATDCLNCQSPLEWQFAMKTFTINPFKCILAPPHSLTRKTTALKEQVLGAETLEPFLGAFSNGAWWRASGGAGLLPSMC